MSRIFERLKKKVKKNKILYMLFYVPNILRRSLLAIHIRRKKAKYHSFVKRVLYGTVALNVPSFSGEFEFDIRSDILERLICDEKYESDCLGIIAHYLDCNKDILDVGANIGLYTVFFAKRIFPGCKVLAVEPTKEAFDLLKKNLVKNNVLEIVEIYNGLAVESAGEYVLKVIPGREEFSTLGSNINQALDHNKKHEEVLVFGNTIDNLVSQFKLKPGFLKIDVEGSEYLTLLGARNTLNLFHPLILSELMDTYLCNFGHSASDVVDYLNQFGYNVIDISTGDAPIFPFDGEIFAFM